MSAVDKRIVEMRFDNKQFERAIRESKKTLEEFESSLGLSKGISGMSKSLAEIEKRFSTMGIVGMTIVQNLTNAAINGGKRIASALIDPLVESGKQRALNIQQAKFQFQGLGMDIEASMASANAAVKGTAYGLDAAAKVASQLGASGMRAGDEMTSALRAVSGVAAMTGSSYEDIGNIMVAVAGQGRLMGDQLLQLSGRGINAAATLAQYLGKTEQEVRELVTAGQISFETFYKAMDQAFGAHATRANETYTGSLSNMRAALARIGAEVASPYFYKMRDVFNALTPQIDRAHEALMPFINGLNQLLDTVGNIAIEKINAFNFDWIEPFTNGIMNIGKSVLSVLKPIGQAFTDVFDIKIWDMMKKISKGFEDITSKMKLGEKQSEKLRTVFQALFSIVETVLTLLSNIAKVAGKGLSALSPALSFLGDLILTLASGIAKVSMHFTDFINKIPSGLAKVWGVMKQGSEVAHELWNEFLQIPIVQSTLESLRKKLEELGETSKKNLSKAKETISEFIQSLKDMDKITLSDVGNALKTFTQNALDWFREITKGVKSPKESLKDFEGEVKIRTKGIVTPFENLRDRLKSVIAKIKDIIESLDLRNLLYNAINLAILYESITIAESVKKFLEAFGGIGKSVGDLLGSIKGFFDEISSYIENRKKIESMDAFTRMIKAIAIIIAELGVLSLLDTNKLKAASKVLMELVGLIGVLSIVNGLLSKKGIMPSNNFNTAGVLAMSASLKIMVSALSDLSKLNPSDLKDSMKDLALLIVYVEAMMVTTIATGNNALKAGSAVVLMTYAIKMMVDLINEISKISKSDIEKGIKVIKEFGTWIAAFEVLSLFSGQNSLKFGASLVLVSAAIAILISIIDDINRIKDEEIIKGSSVIVGALAMFAILESVSSKAGKFADKAGISFLAMSLSILILVECIKNINKLEDGEIIKGTIVVGLLSLLFDSLMIVSEKAGKFADKAGINFLAFSAACVILTLAVSQFGNMNLDTLGKGLLAIGVITACMAALMATSKYIGPANANIKWIAIILGELAALVWLMGNIPQDNLENGEIAVIAITACLSAILFTSQYCTAAKGTLVVLGVIIAELAIVMWALCQLPAENVETVSKALGVSFLALSAALAILSLIGIQGAIAAVGALSVFFLGSAGLFVVFGLLEKIPGFQPTVEKGIEVIELIASGLGSALGAFIEAFAEHILNLVPVIAQKLSEFMTNLQPFIDGAKAVDGSFWEGCANLSKGLLAITAAEFVMAIASFMPSATTLTEFGQELNKFTKEFKIFYEDIQDIHWGTVGAFTDGLKALVDASTGIVGTGGFKTLFVGDASLGKFGLELTKFSDKFKIFYEDISICSPSRLNEYAISLKHLISTMQTASNVNSAGLSNFAKAMKEVAQKGIKGFVEEMENSGPKIQNSAKVVITYFTNAIQSKTAYVQNAARKTAQAFGSSMDNQLTTERSKLLAKMQKIINDIGNRAITVMRGFERTFYSTSANLVTKIAEGMNSQRYAPQRAIAAIIGLVTSRLSGYNNSFYNAGANFSIGLANGIYAYRSRAINAAINVARSALIAAKNELDIHSPSKKAMWLGEQMDRGFALGLLNNTGKVEEAASNIGTVAKMTLQSTIANLRASISDGFDSAPSIRPVMDLTDVQRGYREIGKMFGNIDMTTGFAANTMRYVSQSKKEETIQNVSNSSENNVSNVFHNTFNITSTEPKETAEEISYELNRQVERRGAVWA